jgi:hypothetical protein
MWQYNQTELYHYGVMGMKWGIRRGGRKIGPVGRGVVKLIANRNKRISNYQTKRANKIRENAKSIENQRDKMLALKTKKGRSLFTESDIDNMIKGINYSADKLQRRANEHKYYADQLISELAQLKVRDLNNN